MKKVFTAPMKVSTMSSSMPEKHQLQHHHAFWVVAYAFTVTVMGSTLPTPLYVVYQHLWHFSAVILTLIFVAYVVGVLLALLCFGQISDQLGRKRVLLSSVSMALCGGGLFVLAQGIVWLFVARFFIGVAVGLSMGTATAALTELHLQDNSRYAALVGTASSIMGFGLGPLLAGFLVQYAIWPTKLIFILYLILLIPAFLGVSMIPETVKVVAGESSWRPQRLSVPAEIRLPFIITSVTLFCDFAMLGLFTSLAPSLVINLLHMHNLAVSGAIISIIFATSIVTQLVLRRFSYQPAIGIGMALLLVGLLLMVLAFLFQSLLIFLLSTFCLGIGQGFSYMGSLALINAIAPPLRRGEVLSSYFVVGYIGTALPVLGVGLLIGLVGSYAATVAFAVLIGALAISIAVSMSLKQISPLILHIDKG